MSTTPHPSVQTLKDAWEIAARWRTPAEGMGPEQAQHALVELFEGWSPSDPEGDFEKAAEAALLAAQRAFYDWVERGENCDELLDQLLWILDPAHMMPPPQVDAPPPA